MEICQYPELAMHKADHEKFVSAMNAAYKKLNHDNGLLGLELVYILNDWLTNHIGQMDRKLKPYFNAKGIH